MTVQFGTARLPVRVRAPPGVGCLVIVGAGSGLFVVADLSVRTLAELLRFGWVALLFLATGALLIEAGESADTIFTRTMRFPGFLIFLLPGGSGCVRKDSRSGAPGCPVAGAPVPVACTDRRCDVVNNAIGAAHSRVDVPQPAQEETWPRVVPR
jgi:hypothetical protein